MSDTTNEPKNVFISYRRSNKEVAEKLNTALEANGVPSWYDTDIEYGDNWRESIYEALSNSCVMVLLLSKDVFESDEIKKELALAAQQEIPILTARIEEVKPKGAFAYELAGSNWFNLFPNQDRQIEKLADFLKESVLSQPEKMAQQIDNWSGVDRRPSPFLNPKKILFLVYLFLAISVVQFGVYEWTTGAVQKLNSSGLSPIVSFIYVFVAVTVGSPLLLLSTLKEGVTASEIPLLITSLINTALLVLIITRICKRTANAVAMAKWRKKQVESPV